MIWYTQKQNVTIYYYLLPHSLQSVHNNHSPAVLLFPLAGSNKVNDLMTSELTLTRHVAN